MKRFRVKEILVFAGLCMVSFSCDDNTGGGGDGGGDLPTIAINDFTRFEGDEGLTEFSFPIKLSEASAEDVSFTVNIKEGTAAADEDFEPFSGTITIAAGEVNSEVNVNVKTDTLKEQDESFFVELSNPVNATLNRESAEGIIRNDDTFLAVNEGGYITPNSYAGYDLFWADEFDGSVIDVSAWGYDLGNSGWGNNELQNYTNQSKNSYLSDGNLIIEAIEEPDGTYTSARMLTKDKVEFALGRVDVRAKLPYGQGIWPAIWMLGANFSEIGWPACGEIDIMELVGHKPDEVHGTAHWGPQGASTSISATSKITDPDGYQDEYHVFSIIWDINKIEWFVDDVKIHTVTPQSTAGQTYPFNEPFFMIMNVAVGGNWPGYPDTSTEFPQRMIVDYVRVFQRN